LNFFMGLMALGLSGLYFLGKICEICS